MSEGMFIFSAYARFYNSMGYSILLKYENILILNIREWIVYITDFNNK